MRKCVLIFLSAGSLALIIAWLFPWVLPRALRLYEPAIVYRGNPGEKIVYLTIDDAPTAHTADILAVLARHRVRATFFIIADRVKSDADLQAIVAAGHTLGHHLRTTRSAPALDWETFKADFDFTDRLLRKFVAPQFFRPPSGFATSAQLAYARDRGYRPVVGTVFPLDHWIENPAILCALIRWLVIPGGILILHDGDARAPRTAAVLDEIIPKLRHAGFEFAPLPANLPASP